MNYDAVYQAIKDNVQHRWDGNSRPDEDVILSNDISLGDNLAALLHDESVSFTLNDLTLIAVALEIDVAELFSP